MIKKGVYRILFIIVRNARVGFYRLLSNQSIEGPVLLMQATQVCGLGRVMAKNVVIGYFPSPFFFSTYSYLEVRSPLALISIGNNTKINNGFVAICEETSIEIGENCLIGTKVEIVDSDFHAISSHDRKKSDRSICASVRIGNDVFIGSNVKIMKGVHIGDGAVIANGAIVLKDIPAQTLAAGVPAIVIKTLSNG